MGEWALMIDSAYDEPFSELPPVRMLQSSFGTLRNAPAKPHKLELASSGVHGKYSLYLFRTESCF